MNAAVALAACQHIHSNKYLNQNLQANIRLFKQLAYEANIHLMPSQTPISRRYYW